MRRFRFQARALPLLLLLFALLPGSAWAMVACITDTTTGSCCCTADEAVCESLDGTASTEASAMKLCCHTDEIKPEGVLAAGESGGDAVAVSVGVGTHVVDCTCICAGDQGLCEPAKLVTTSSFAQWLRGAILDLGARLTTTVGLASPRLEGGASAECACARTR